MSLDTITSIVSKSFRRTIPWLLRMAFFVNRGVWKKLDEDEELVFCIGKVEGDYIHLDQSVIGTEHNFYFEKGTVFKHRFFTVPNRISVLRSIDCLIDRDLYVGGDWESHERMPLEAFIEMIRKFPTSTKKEHNANQRVSLIIREFFPESDRYIEIYKKYIDRKNKGELHKEHSKAKIEFDIERFRLAVDRLEYMMADCDAFDEDSWKNEIQDILRVLYPKYIYILREVRLKNQEKNDKQPDFVLVDTNGFIDILEVKKANVELLTRNPSYRNNYVPRRDFSGTVQQIEKYFYEVMTEPANKDILAKRINPHLPEGMKLSFGNPQGIIIAGRSNDFKGQKSRDFEIIKTQYKNIVDIMTYDDLLNRLKNVVAALEMQFAEK